MTVAIGRLQITVALKPAGSQSPPAPAATRAERIFRANWTREQREQELERVQLQHRRARWL